MAKYTYLPTYLPTCLPTYHCHDTGKYKGAAHSIYNLKFDLPNEIPLVFHNDWNYDYSLIIK